MSLDKQVFLARSLGLPLQERQVIITLVHAMTGLQLSSLPTTMMTTQKVGHLHCDTSKRLAKDSAPARSRGGHDEHPPAQCAARQAGLTVEGTCMCDMRPGIGLRCPQWATLCVGAQGCVSKHAGNLGWDHNSWLHRHAVLTPRGEAHHVSKLSLVVESLQPRLL